MKIHPLISVSHSQRLAVRHKPTPHLAAVHTRDLHYVSTYQVLQQAAPCVREIGWSPAELVPAVVAEMEQVALAPGTGGTERIRDGT